MEFEWLKKTIKPYKKEGERTGGCRMYKRDLNAIRPPFHHPIGPPPPRAMTDRSKRIPFGGRSTKK